MFRATVIAALAFIGCAVGGFVARLAAPDANTTGFTLYEYAISGKWLELLKEIAPRVTRAAGVLRDAAIGNRTCVIAFYHQRRLPAAKLTGR